MIIAENLFHIYNTGENEEIAALKNINLEISEGEFVTVIGPNGSGKSTLAKHFNALLMPTSGDVIVDGINTKNSEYLWDIRQKVGMVFQNPDNQLVATVVEEDIAFGPENLGIEPDELRSRINAALKTVNMESYREFAPHLLSGGQKQKIAIAGVIAMQPECIVLDEPTSMLDPSGREEVMKTIKKLNRQKGVTVIHITHFMDEAVDCDRVMVMNEGEIILDDKPADIFSQVETIQSIGLDVPQMTELAYELNKSGFEIKSNVLDVDEMMMQLCP